VKTMDQKTINPQKLFNAKDLAQFLGVSHPTALNLMKSPNFPSVQISGSRKVAYGALMDFLKCQKVV